MALSNLTLAAAKIALAQITDAHFQVNPGRFRQIFLWRLPSFHLCHASGQKQNKKWYRLKLAVPLLRPTLQHLSP